MAKTAVEQIISRVLRKVQDPSFSNDDVLLALNNCLVDIASSLDIKQLATVSDVELLGGDNTVALPDDFHKIIMHAYNKTTNRSIKVFSSRVLIDKITRPTSPGNICALAEESPNIYCNRIANTDQTISVWYLRLPDELEDGGEFPAWIPNNYIYNLFFNYAASELYDFVEDSMQGDKVNTAYHSNKYDEHLEKFRLFIGPNPDHPYTLTQSNIHFNFEE